MGKVLKILVRLGLGDYGDYDKPVDSGKSGESCDSSESDAPVDFCESGDSGVYGAVLLAILVILMNL